MGKITLLHIESDLSGEDVYQRLFDYDYEQMHGTINSLRTSEWKEWVNGKPVPVKRDGYNSIANPNKKDSVEHEEELVL